MEVAVLLGLKPTQLARRLVVNGCNRALYEQQRFEDGTARVRRP